LEQILKNQEDQRKENVEELRALIRQRDIPPQTQSELRKLLERLEADSITTPAGTLLIKDVQLSSSFPPGCDPASQGCFRARTGEQFLIVWLALKDGASIPPEVINELEPGRQGTDEVQVLTEDGYLAKRFGGGMLDLKLFVLFSVPASARNFVLVWPGNPAIKLTPTGPVENARLSISSIPTGSEVFVAGVDELGIKLNDRPEWNHVVRRGIGLGRLGVVSRLGHLEDPRGQKSTEIVKIAKVVDEKYKQGVTPVSLSLKPGNYVVLLAMPPTAPALMANAGERLSEVVENDSVHGWPIWLTNMGAVGGPKRPCRAYLIELLAGQSDSLIQVWQRIGASLGELEQMYSQQDTVRVDETPVRSQLTGVMPGADIPAVMRLLRRGGKVVYRQGEIRLILQMSQSGGDLETMVKYKGMELLPINTPMEKK